MIINNKKPQQIRAAIELFSVKRKQLSSPPRDDQNINTRSSSAINWTNPINQSTVYKSGLWKLLLGSQFKQQSTWRNQMVKREIHVQFMRSLEICWLASYMHSSGLSILLPRFYQQLKCIPLSFAIYSTESHPCVATIPAI